MPEDVQTILRGSQVEAVIDRRGPTVVIGERINPTGHRRLARSLEAGDFSFVVREAQAQVEAGAQVIDINVGLPGIDEPKMLAGAVQAVAEVVGVPLCLDSANSEALKAALAVCPGKPLLNSVSGEEASLAAVLPLVAERGTAVIGLCMDEGGVPGDVEGRLEIARKIVSRAEALGIPRQEVVLDCLVTAVSVDQRAALVTLEAMRRVREELGVNLTLGCSNVSFGLPDRVALNATFLAMALAAGLTCAIVDPTRPEVMAAIRASDLLLGQDGFAMHYIAHYRSRQSRMG